MSNGVEAVNTDDGGDAGLIRLVDLSGIHGDDTDEEMNSSRDDSDVDESERESEEEDDDEDSHARRIRERMERSMKDAGSDEDEGSESDDPSDDESMMEEDKKKKFDEEMIDPAAEELNDGFFDIHDMEAFADEEEDIHLPELYGDDDADEEAEDSVSISESDDERDQNDAAASDSESEGETDILFAEKSGKKNKKKSSSSNKKKRVYRSEEDVKALISIYDELESDEDDNAGQNMTAAQFFGEPNPKYLGRNGMKNRRENDDDVDSWDDHDFNEKDNSSGWNF